MDIEIDEQRRLEALRLAAGFTCVPGVGEDGDSIVLGDIDFDAGKDANTGAAADAAWKHCPGDKRAEAAARSAKMATMRKS